MSAREWVIVGYAIVAVLVAVGWTAEQERTEWPIGLMRAFVVGLGWPLLVVVSAIPTIKKMLR